ncbi:aldo-keto reductase [Penicillium sp. IBT 18751x]|nr:aldo-keto reductase [Penicillium sp. IBT 18751x]
MSVVIGKDENFASMGTAAGARISIAPPKIHNHGPNPIEGPSNGTARSSYYSYDVMATPLTTPRVLRKAHEIIGPRVNPSRNENLHWRHEEGEGAKKLLETAKIPPAEPNSAAFLPVTAGGFSVLEGQEYSARGVQPAPAREQRLQPFTINSVVNDTAVVEIANKLNIDSAQMLISRAFQRGSSVLPQSVTPARIESNFKFVIPDAESDARNKLDHKKRHNYSLPW